MLISDNTIKVLSKNLSVEYVLTYEELKVHLDNLISSLNLMENVACENNHFVVDYCLISQLKFLPTIKTSLLNENLIVTVSEFEIVGIGQIQ